MGARQHNPGTQEHSVRTIRARRRLRTYSRGTLIALSVRPVVLPLPYFLSPLMSRVCVPSSHHILCCSISPSLTWHKKANVLKASWCCMEGDRHIRGRLGKFLAPLAAQGCPDHDDHDDLRSWCCIESMHRPLLRDGVPDLLHRHVVKNESATNVSHKARWCPM